MKPALGMFSAIIIGILVGFFGVFNSVFSDGPIDERLTVIAAILIIYGILGALWGFILPGKLWPWILSLSLPALIMLALFMFSEFNFYYSVYMVLLILVTWLGVAGGNRIRRNKL